MLKKIMSVMLALSLLLGTMGVAFAWSCPNCGNENGSNFCSECGTKRPEERICPGCGANHGQQTYAFCPECGTKMDGSTPVSTPVPTEEPYNYLNIQDITRNENGSVTVTWSDNGMGPYTVRYTVKQSEDYQADVNSDVNSGRWIATSSCEDTSYVLTHIVPGYSYWISVLDSNGEGKYRAYNAPETVEQVDFTATMSFAPRTRVGEEVSEISGLVASDIIKEDDISYGGYLQIQYSGLTQARESQVVVALTAPNGAVIVDTVTRMSFSADGSYTRWWDFFNLDWYFSQVERLYEQILTGEYTISAYLDGKLACSTTFQVYNTAAEASLITSIVRNDDGTVTVSWQDNGKGPYKLRYTQKVSDVYEEDVKSDKTTGRWIDAEDLQATSQVMKYLIPGETYWIHLTDSTGEGEIRVYEHADAGAFDLPVTISRIYRTRVGEEITDVEGFYLSEMDLEGDTEYGLYVQINYPAQEVERAVQCLAVLVDPDGVTLSVSAPQATLKGGDDPYLFWNFFKLNWSLGEFADRFEGLKSGTYRFDVYMDGRYAGGVNFDILAEKPAPVMEVADAQRNADGTVTLTWADPEGNGPYEVDYLLARSDDFQADYGAAELIWVDEDDVTGTSCVMDYLVPGHAYWLVVEDAQGNLAHMRYEHANSAFVDAPVRMTLQPKVRTGEAEENRAAFSQAEILAGEKEMGAFLRVSYDQQGSAQSYAALFAVTAPNGEVVTDYITTLKLETGENRSTYWSFYGFDWYFEVMKNNFGTVETGTYVVDLYLDGMHAASVTFTVAE